MSMIDLFLFWVILLVTFGLGFLTGWMKANPKNLEELSKTIKRRAAVGPIRRPTAEQLAKRKNKLLIETEQAMEETLKQIL